MVENVDWQGKRYYSLDAYFKHTYGCKCYKIAVDAGFTCPNRDGNLDDRGCIFCSAGGSGDFAVKGICDIDAQITAGLQNVKREVGERFVIYFQAYTNTYSDAEHLRKLYEKALDHENVVGISIATRPDCLGEEIIELLKELREKYSKKGKFIWVELGLQTIHEKTAIYIRRHYPLKVYEEAVKNLKMIGIPYITHVILGLPGETSAMMLETVKYVCELSCKPFGIKLQLLHVLEKTDLANDYAAGKFAVMSEDEYVDIICNSLRLIDKNIVIHRLTGDGPKDILIAPRWSTNKKHVLNNINHTLKIRDIYQGDSL